MHALASLSLQQAVVVVPSRQFLINHAHCFCDSVALPVKMAFPVLRSSSPESAHAELSDGKKLAGWAD